MWLFASILGVAEKDTICEQSDFYTSADARVAALGVRDHAVYSPFSGVG